MQAQRRLNAASKPASWPISMLTFCDSASLQLPREPHERCLFQNRLKKKSRAAALLGKLCRPFIPEMFGFILD
jgi:hypothetical protein